MKRTNRIFGRRSAALALAGMMALLGFSATAQADFTGDHVFLVYNVLDFNFRRTAANAQGVTIGTFSILSDATSTVNAAIRTGAAPPVTLDSARISDGDNALLVNGLRETPQAKHLGRRRILLRETATVATPSD